MNPLQGAKGFYDQLLIIVSLFWILIRRSNTANIVRNLIYIILDVNHWELCAGDWSDIVANSEVRQSISRMETIPAILVFCMIAVVTSSQNGGDNLGYGRNYNSVLQSQFMDVNAAIAIEEKLSKVYFN